VLQSLQEEGGFATIRGDWSGAAFVSVMLDVCASMGAVSSVLRVVRSGIVMSEICLGDSMNCVDRVV
jgi:hypothetical protein